MIGTLQVPRLTDSKTKQAYASSEDERKAGVAIQTCCSVLVGCGTVRSENTIARRFSLVNKLID